MKFKCGHIHNAKSGDIFCPPCLLKLEKDGLLECATCAFEECRNLSPADDATPNIETIPRESRPFQTDARSESVGEVREPFRVRIGKWRKWEFSENPRKEHTSYCQKPKEEAKHQRLQLSSSTIFPF